MPGRLAKAEAEERLWSGIEKDQDDMRRIGRATHDLAYRVGRVAARFALPTSRLEMEMAPTARDLETRMRRIAGGLVEMSLQNLDDLDLDWERQRAISSGSAPPQPRPFAFEQPTEASTDADLPPTTEAALLELFEVGLLCHRYGRELYFLARRFEMKIGPGDAIDTFLARRPTVRHLAWNISETADGAHGHFVDFGRELIAASKAHSAANGTQWAGRQDAWDQDRTLV